jgi:hypothetical protein
LAALDSAREVFREHIEANHGRVVDMAGDSVLAVFETATGAVEVQERLAERNAPLPEDRRMRFRIGVSLGDAIARDDGTIYGDAVEIDPRNRVFRYTGTPRSPRSVCSNHLILTAEPALSRAEYRDCSGNMG